VEVTNPSSNDATSRNSASPPLVPELMRFKVKQTRGLELREAHHIRQRGPRRFQAGEGGGDSFLNDGPQGVWGNL
jgi:hypothetical protein